MSLDDEDKLILGTKKNNSNFMINSFKKEIVINSLYDSLAEDLLSYQAMYEGQEALFEPIVYKIEKYSEEDSSPIQSFWLFGSDEYRDFQIKSDRTYVYKLSCYCLIYGNQKTIRDFAKNGSNITLTIINNPSYKYAVLDLDEEGDKSFT